MNVTNRCPNIYGLQRGFTFIGKIIDDICMRWYTVAGIRKEVCEIKRVKGQE